MTMYFNFPIVLNVFKNFSQNYIKDPDVPMLGKLIPCHNLRPTTNVAQNMIDIYLVLS